MRPQARYHVRSAKCGLCGAVCPPNKPRVFSQRSWLCPGCAYKLEHPEASERSLAPPAAQKRTRDAQPSLFAIDGYI
jgi:hypothetical protein